MPFDKKLYREYEIKLNKLTLNDLRSAQVVDSMFSQLLSLLPNDGKLYKYKALDTFHIDELQEKYIWFSSAKNLNDNKDCTFNENSQLEFEKIVKLLMRADNYRKLLAMSLRNKLRVHVNQLSLDEVETFLNAIVQKRGCSAEVFFQHFCNKHHLKNADRQSVIDAITLYSENPDEKTIRKRISNYFDSFVEIRNSMMVCSLTTSYQKDSMWAYYCNNKGVCLEYDFSRIDTLEAKKLFMQMQKVRYGRKKKFSTVKLLQEHLEGTEESICGADSMVFDQLLTKDKSWSMEDEWRAIVSFRENIVGKKAFVDIVSAIYIDYSVLTKRKTKQIIQLAKENGWSVYIRYFDPIKVSYIYDTIPNIKKIKKQADQLKVKTLH